MNEEKNIDPISPVAYRPPSDRRRTPKVGVSLVKIGVFVVLVLLGIIVWFVLTARSLVVDTVPSDTDVALSGVVIPIADRYLVRPGNRRLTVEADGYVTASQEITIDDRPSQSIRVELERLPGHLEIVTDPAIAAATVAVDGVEYTGTPVTVRDLKAGDYEVIVNAPRYRPFREIVKVEGLDLTQSIAVTLEPAWAQITFATQQDSEPGPTVYVDSNAIGASPGDYEVLEGKRMIEIRKPGFKTWRREVSVVAGEALSFTDIELELADATLKLVTTPAGANVTIDGAFEGQTPTEIAVAPNKKVTVRVFKTGFQSASRQVTLNAGESRELTLSLPRESGRLTLKIEPKDAKVSIDGRAVADWSSPMSIGTGAHTVTVSRDGYATAKRDIRVQSGAPQTLNIKLATNEEARQAQVAAKQEKQAEQRRSLPTSISTTDGQKLTLIRPHGFTMGASRRERGRRANEQLRSVELKRPYYLSVNEVTNEAFKKFKPDHPSVSAGGQSLSGASQPVVKITWADAAAYCNWLSQQQKLRPVYQLSGGEVTGFDRNANGYRLPTEAEWAFAARVKRDKSLLKFPWGDAQPPTLNSGNFADASARNLLARVINGYSDNFEVSAPVGSFTPNRFGINDLGGNVAEWVHDVYRLDIASSKERIDPMGGAVGELHSIRGSSWRHGTDTELRLSYRDYGKDPRDDLGFRLARTAL